MKILQVIPSLNKGGAERMVMNISRALKQQGHEVKIVLLRPVIAYNVPDVNVEITLTHLQLSLWKKNEVDVSNLQKVISEFQPDVVHSHLFEAEINLAFVNFPENCKRIVHFHDNMHQFQRIQVANFFSKTHWTNLFEKFKLLANLKKYNTTFISISDHGESYINDLRLGFAKQTKLHNAIDLNVFKSFQKSVKIENLIMVGPMVEKKNQKLAIEALKELHGRGYKLNLILLGDGPQKQALEEKSYKEGIAEYVKFKGLVNHPEEYLNDSFLYLHTAKYEPFGLVLLEAMACGLPVVSTNGGGNADLIKEGENGFLVSSFSAEELANKIELLLEDEKLYKEMSENACNFAQQFGMENYVDKLLEIYKS